MKEAGVDVGEARKVHHAMSERMRELTRNDLKEATTNENLEVITFDMQKVLAVPKLETSIVYYFRQLSLLNFGVHS